MKHIKWKQLFHWAGLGIGILGIAFVVRKLSEYSDQIDFSGFTFLSICVLFGMMVAYGSANIFLALAWRDLLLYLGVSTAKKWAIQTYGISQIAKYVPGNIFHFAGRQAIGQAAGLPALPLAKSAVWEIGLLATTGLLFSVLVIPLYFHWISFNFALIGFILVLVISILAVKFLGGKRIATAMEWYLLFLVISGVIFEGIIIRFTPMGIGSNSIFIGIVGVYVIAWLAGLMTPGAPAGLGVREVVFLTILHSFISEGELLKAIVLGRFVTVGGDFLFYAFSMWMRFRERKT